MEPVLDVEKLNLVYHTEEGPLPALSDVSFQVQPGEIVGVVGESGCGKSSIAMALLRLLPPNGSITGGRLMFKGEDLMALDSAGLRALRGRDLAMIFQDPMTSLNPVLTIGSQMTDVQKAHPGATRLGSADVRRRAVEILEQVGIPDAAQRIDEYPHQFSGGMLQRVMIAMALLSRPALLIADEPTSSLDVTLEVQILELMKQLREAYETAILFISHDLGVIAQLCDRVVVMYTGRVVEEGDVLSLYERPLHPYTQVLLAAVPSREHHGQRLNTIEGQVPSLAALPPGCKFADRCQFVQPICREQEPDTFKVDGRQVCCHLYGSEFGYGAFPHSGTVSAPLSGVQAAPAQDRATVQDGVLLELHDLSKYFRDQMGLFERALGRRPGVVRAVDNVSLDIRRGEVLGLVGESGSGKTTLGQTVLGLIPLESGSMIYDGQELARAGKVDRRRLSARMQMIFQDMYASLNPRLRVSYLVTEPYTIHRVPEEERYTVSELLSMVGLSDELATKYAHELSGGQARRVNIARALTLRPEFLIADEPTSGLDVSVAANILNLMKDLADQLGLTYLIITHNLNVVGYISDRVAVMYLGNLVEVGPTDVIFERPGHPYTVALLSAISEPDPRRRRAQRRLLLKGEIPSARNPPPGCRFHTRCPFVEGRCKSEVPIAEEIEPGHTLTCHFWERVKEA